MMEKWPSQHARCVKDVHYFFLNSRFTEVLRPADSALASPAAELTMMMPPGTVIK